MEVSNMEENSMEENSLKANNMEESRKEIDILKLGNELTLRRYLFSKAQVTRVLNAPDYIALYIIRETGSAQEIYGGKTYLKDLSEKMQLSIRQTSKMIGSLKDRGLIKWLHDGDGSDGTYVTITAEGIKLLEQQQAVFREYYGKVIGKFGKDNLIQLLNLMKQLETVMSSELEGMEAIEDVDGRDE